MKALRSHREQLNMKRIGFVSTEKVPIKVQLKSSFRENGRIRNAAFARYKAPVKILRTDFSGGLDQFKTL
jgi:hypothetical protein